MRILIVVIVLTLAVGLGAWSAAGESKSCCAAGACHGACGCSGGSADGCQPKGGLFPYGRGLLNWWPQGCFPYCGAPDDYCQKPLPCVCWPPYPEYYQFGPPDACCVERECER